MKSNLKIAGFIFLLCFLFQNSYSQQNTNGWYWINGKPQCNTLNWVKIIDAKNYYAVGESGTFMKSSDAGDTWLINTQAGVSDPSFDSHGTMRLYSAWFFNANTGIVTGQSVLNDGGKIKRTTDGGNTFTTIGLGIPPSTTFMPPRITDIYFINSTTGYICGDSIVKAFKTTDGGLSWTLFPNLPSLPSTYNCIYAKDANNIFLGVATDGYPNQRRIVRTTNAGVTWKIDTLPGATIVDVKDIEFRDANTGYVVGNSIANNPSYFAYTVNGGASWTEAIFPNKQHGLYDLEIIGPNVYALGASYTYYHYTTNLGVTWDSVNYNDATNPDQPYQGLVYSFDINGNDAIVVGLNGKINVSNDAGSSWRNKNYSVGNNLYGFSTIYALPGTGRVWAGSNGGGFILYSTNNGTTWTQQQTSAANSFYDINMLNPSTGYAAGGSFFSGTGYCYKTTTSGANWSSLPITYPNAQVNAIDFVNVNTGWLTGISGVLSKTTNGGLTWTTQTTTPAYTLNFFSH
ncbi:MAG: hypothetical protein IPL53_25220 [Ignavibacteria bacterium]|nr:hypothetical protein [Ignavibacteria bacterium]